MQALLAAALFGASHAVLPLSDPRAATAPLASASVEVAKEAGRRLQAHGKNVRDLGICDNDPGIGPGGALEARVGTLHDDQTGEQVDCTMGGCGGLDAGHNGYGDDLDCSKTIMAPASHTVNLIFTHFNLEMCGSGGGGTCDYVEVFDGNSASSPSLGQFSGTELPHAIVSSGQFLTVHFKTDGGNAQIQGSADPGFYADWHFIEVLNNQGICGAPAIITDAHGVIHDDPECGDFTTGCGHSAHEGVNCQTDPSRCSGGTQGYGAALNCYMTLQAGKDQQVELDFTQMNLEKDNTPGCGTCPPGGCDYVNVFDGPDEQSPLLGSFSGNPAQLPSVVSSGETMHIRFKTDNGNCNIAAAEDPGFFAKWTFLENGQNICEPSAAVLKGRHGVLHDDAKGHTNCNTGVCNGANTGENGYGDNLDCGVRIRAGKGELVNLHFSQLNLEGGQNGYCGAQNPLDCSASGDYVEIFDGTDENAPKIGHVTGSMTDAFAPDGTVVQESFADSFTSTGRNLYVRFVTDTGNYGLMGTTADPGFYAEWTVIKQGAACQAFSPIPSTGIVGHNNEDLADVSLADCEDACCARDWCKSFDFIAGPSGPTAKGGRCELADLDASNDYGKVVSGSPWTLYERDVPAPPEERLGSAGCASDLAGITAQVNAECCPAGGCTGTPNHCSEECSAVWLPFSRKCSTMLEETMADSALFKITAACEKMEYGRYKAGSNHGRCSDGDQEQWLQELGPACCGDNAEYCPGYTGDNIEVPMENGQPVCLPDCGDTVEQMYAECHPRWEVELDPESLAGIKQFLGLCQGFSGGGGHRRQLLAEGDAPPSPQHSARIPKAMFWSEEALAKAAFLKTYEGPEVV